MDELELIKDLHKKITNHTEFCNGFIDGIESRLSRLNALQREIRMLIGKDKINNDILDSYGQKIGELNDRIATLEARIR